MPISEQYGDDVVGGVNLGHHLGSLRSSGLTSNHAAFVLVVVGLIGLWLVSRIFKGA